MAVDRTGSARSALSRAWRASADGRAQGANRRTLRLEHFHARVSGNNLAVRFSSRLPPFIGANALSAAIDAARAGGIDFVDLTESNPTSVGLPCPQNLLEPLADVQALRYRPQPFGLWAAREAVAAEASRRGVAIDPSQVILTASTSEAYSWLFKLLCEPGDAVLVPRPSYPLFEHLTRLDSVVARPYDLEYGGSWSIDIASVERALSD